LLSPFLFMSRGGDSARDIVDDPYLARRDRKPNVSRRAAALSAPIARFRASMSISGMRVGSSHGENRVVSWKSRWRRRAYRHGHGGEETDGDRFAVIQCA
jgi:hypothetical protein